MDSIRYFYLSIFPLVVLIRLLSRGRDPGAGSDLRPTPAAVGWLLTKVLTVERRLIFPLNRLAGLSVVAVAKT